MGILADEYGKPNLKGILIVLIVGFQLLTVPIHAWNLYTNGIPRTHKGSVIYAAQQYSKWYDYDYTNIEVLTYSGDSHHVQFWDHIDFDLGEAYEIHTVIENRYYFPWGWVENEKIVEIIKVEASG